MSKEPMKEPTPWMLFLGLACLFGALVLLMLIPANSWGF